MAIHRIHKHLICSAACVLLVTCAWAQSSVLSGGTWYKMTITKSGVYKLDYDQLKKAGMDVDGIDPRTIKVYGNPGGMLPQANTTMRASDLIEGSILVYGETDGVFNNSDYIVFYAQGADKQKLDVNRKTFAYEQNLYAEKNYHFLTAGGNVGKRIQLAPDVTGTATITSFEDVAHHELTTTNILKSGREWFGERFSSGTERTIKMDIEGIVPGTVIRVVSDVVAYSLQGSSFTLAFNGVQAGEQKVDQVPNSQYGLKARHKRDTLLLASETVVAAGSKTQELTYRFSKSGTLDAYGHLDFFTITSTRKLAVYGGQTLFRSLNSLSQATSTFTLENANADTRVWDVTDPANPLMQTLALSESMATFSAATESLKEFIAFTEALTPETTERIDNQNLHGLPVVGMLIVTDEELRDEAQRLADHRTNHSQVPTVVATVQEIYNEFSSGRADVTAIRDFARYLKQRYPADFQYLLLFGRGTYDYKNIFRDNISRVPAYESRNSLSPLETYSSDDFYGMLDEAEGDWKECPGCNETLDIGVGRIPIKKIEQARNVVDKIIHYDTDMKGRGSWQTNVTVVADDGDANVHVTHANSLANLIENNTTSVFRSSKIFLDAYEQISKPAFQISPDATDAVKRSFTEGSLIVNYTGHGNEYKLAQETILDELLIVNTRNKHLPFLVTATCEFGRQDDPLVTSVAEIALLQRKP